MNCPGGYCEMCPIKIQLECEMTIKDRIEHIRQCVRRMKPTMGFEVAAAAEIEKELVVLDESFAVLTEALVGSHGEINRLSEMVRAALKGGTW